MGVGVPLRQNISHWIYENLKPPVWWLGEGFRTPGQLYPCPEVTAIRFVILVSRATSVVHRRVVYKVSYS